MRPLENKLILAASSAKKMSALSDGLRAVGARVQPFPAIEIRENEDMSILDEALESLERYAWIIFTSAYAADFFSRRFEQRGIRRHKLRNVRICAIGPSTAETLSGAGFEADLIPERFTAEGVVEALGKFCRGIHNLSGRRILLPRAKEARDVLPRALLDAGAHVDIAVCYQTVPPEISDADIRRLTAETPDLVVFTSSSTVKNTMAFLGDSRGKKLLENSTVAVIGPITAATVESFGKHAEIVPEESTIAALIHAIEEHFRLK